MYPSDVIAWQTTWNRERIPTSGCRLCFNDRQTWIYYISPLPSIYIKYACRLGVPQLLHINSTTTKKYHKVELQHAICTLKWSDEWCVRTQLLLRFFQLGLREEDDKKIWIFARASSGKKGNEEKEKDKNITSIDGKERWMDIISNWIGTLPGRLVLILRTF